MRACIFSIRMIALNLIFLAAINSQAFAQSDTCYSVQVASIFDKESTYKNTKKYPSSCEVLSFANLKAVRCGCLDTYKQAQTELKKLRKKHRGAIIVRTYRSRFSKTFKNEEVLDTEALAEYEEQGEIPLKLRVQYYFYESELAVQGHIDLISQAYLTGPNDKHKSNTTATGQVELDFSKDDFKGIAKIYAQGDLHDFQGSSSQNDRSFIRVDELYGKYDFDNDQIMFGKNIRFWGALEVRNITDNFNISELRADPFETDKLGSWNAAYTHYTDSGELSLIIKLDEQDREMSSYPYIYYFFPDTVSGLPLHYDNQLQTEKSRNRPSIYLKSSGSTDTEYALDYAVILENGYDSQRYYTQTLSTGGTSIKTNENAYLVNKLLTYNTLVLGSTLFKAEAVYADVINNSVISDYYHLGLGLEHTLNQFYKEADLGLIAEYYKYETLEDGKRNDLQLFELFQNDLFLGARYSLNDGNDASIVGGAILDLDYNEQVYYLEYEGRLAEMFKLNLDYRYISPSQNYLTAFNLMGRHQRMSLKLGYYF